MWARRLIIGSSLAVASLAMVPSAAGAATDCSSANTPASMTEPSTGAQCPTISASATSPSPTGGTAGTSTGTDGVSGTSSLPFTGADIGEIAVVGAGAVLAGGLLARRRRRNVA